jgi:aromatic ring-opening dioxygenase LigB subunit
MIVGGAVMPAEPVLIPEVGRGRERDAVKTVGACRRAARFVAECAPETVVIAIAGEDRAPELWLPGAGGLRRDFTAVDAPELDRVDRVDTELARALLADGGAPAWATRSDETAPEAALFPLSFLVPDAARRVLLLAVPPDLAGAGAAGARLARAAEQLGRRCVVVAAGHLASGPERSVTGYRAAAAAFDERVLAALEHGDVAALLTVPDAERTTLGETLLSPLTMGLGALGGSVGVEPLAYQHPFGCGYAVALLHSVAAGCPDRPSSRH